MSGNQKLDSIQGARALGAWLVAIGHAAAFAIALVEPSGTGPLTRSNWFTPTLGQAGVDVFFVISGMIMVIVVRGNAMCGASQVGGFLWRRLVRIYPLYWLTMPISVWLAATTPFDWPNLVKYVALVHQPDGFPVAWSLVYELRFYIIISPALFFSGIWRTVSLICSFLAIIFVVGIDAIGVWRLPDYGDPILLEFVMGGIVGYLISNGVRAGAATALLLGATGFLVGCVALSPLGGWTLYYRFLCFGLTSAVAIYGLVSLDILGRVRVPNSVVEAGNHSYSVYLWHWVIVTGLYYNWPIAWRDLIAASAFFSVSIALTAITAFVSYHLIEKNTSIGWRRRTSEPTPIAGGA